MNRKLIYIIFILLFASTAFANQSDPNKNSEYTPGNPYPGFSDYFRQLYIGDQALNIDRAAVLITIVGIEQSGNFVIRFEEGSLRGQIGGGWNRASLAVTSGCNQQVCVGNLYRNMEREYALVQIVGIQYDGRFATKFLSGPLSGQTGYNWTADSFLLQDYGCQGGICVGDQFYNIVRDYALVTLIGFQGNGKLVIRFETGPLAGKIGGDWGLEDLARTKF